MYFAPSAPRLAYKYSRLIAGRDMHNDMLQFPTLCFVVHCALLTISE